MNSRYLDKKIDTPRATVMFLWLASSPFFRFVDAATRRSATGNRLSLLSLTLSIFLFCAMAVPGFAVPIDLPGAGINTDFETPNLGGNSGAEQFSTNDIGTGWTVTGVIGNLSNYGVQDPPTSFYGSSHPLPAPFVGNQYGFVNMNDAGAVVHVDSSVFGTLQASAMYTLNVAVGERGGSAYDLDYEIGLLANGVEIGSFTTGNTTPGNILDMQYTLDTATVPGNVGEDLQIRIRGTRLSAGFSQMNFDNVRLDAVVSVPEPSTFALAAVGLLSLIMLGRRRRRS